MERFGEEFFCLCFEQYGTFLQALGGSLVEFYSNIDGLQQHIASLKLTSNHRVRFLLIFVSNADLLKHECHMFLVVNLYVYLLFLQPVVYCMIPILRYDLKRV